MAEPGDDLPGLHRPLHVVHDELLRWLLPAQLLLHLHQPRQALLVGEAVQRPGQAAEARCPSVIRVAKRGAHEVAGVGGDIAALVVRVEHEVEARYLLERLAVVHAQHLRVVAGPIQLRVVGRDLAILEGAAVDVRGYHWDLSDEVQGIFERRLPILVLLHALLVARRELRVLLQRQHADRKLCHWVRLLRQRGQGGEHILRHSAARMELLRELPDLVV
mmetsp:Transcript_22933/g.65168  ORF Transcript_22933/g.65168 Transcript_22933/m.65168 type:complete len:219 (+) Transcript_22933:665-1321(+)